MKKKLIFFTIMFSVALVVSYYLNIFPVVIEAEKYSDLNKLPRKLKEGNRVNIFDDFNFSKGGYSLYIVCSNSEKLGFSKVLFTDEKIVLNQLKDAFELVYTGGDIVTPESCLYLKLEDEIIFKTYIVLDRAMGIQSESYGWLESENSDKLKKAIRQLKQLYYPFIIL